MRKFLSLAIVPLLASCASLPARAEEPLPPNVAAMADAKTERMTIDTKIIDALKSYLSKASIEALRQCQANSRFWYCPAETLLSGIMQDAKPCLECKPKESKQKTDE